MAECFSTCNECNQGFDHSTSELKPPPRERLSTTVAVNSDGVTCRFPIEMFVFPSLSALFILSPMHALRPS